MVRRLFREWTVNIRRYDHPDYGPGFQALAYIARLDGTKTDVRTYGRYHKSVKTHEDMFDYVRKMLDQ